MWVSDLQSYKRSPECLIHSQLLAPGWILASTKPILLMVISVVLSNIIHSLLTVLSCLNRATFKAKDERVPNSISNHVAK